MKKHHLYVEWELEKLEILEEGRLAAPPLDDQRLVGARVLQAQRRRAFVLADHVLDVEPRIPQSRPLNLVRVYLTTQTGACSRGLSACGCQP